MTGLIRLLGAHQVAEVVFVADGAEWIWNQLPQLAIDAGLANARVYFILDFYHATEHIAQALDACRA